MRDWDQIEREYVEGNSTYEEISKNHDIPLSSVKKHGSNKDWKLKRQRYRGLELYQMDRVDKKTAIINGLNRIIDAIEELQIK